MKTMKVVLSLFLGVFVFAESLGLSSDEALVRKSRDARATLSKISGVMAAKFKAVKRAQPNEREAAGGLTCFACKSSGDSNSCVGSTVTCQPGEICASVWHTDDTNFDGCMAPTLCHMMVETAVAHATCCSTDMCNMGTR